MKELASQRQKVDVYLGSGVKAAMSITQQASGLQALQRAVWAFRRLSLFRSLLDEPGFREMRTVLELIASSGSTANRQAGPDLYHSLVAALAELARSFDSPYHSDPWRELVMNAAIFTETLFSVTASRSSANAVPVPQDLLLAARHDLGLLGELYCIDVRWLQAAIIQTSPGIPRHQGMLPGWADMVSPVPPHQGDPIAAIKARLSTMTDWSDAATELLDWHRVNGSGPAARHRALWWQGRESPLAGITRPDPVRLADLEGYARQKSIVVENTRRFVSRIPAQNLLLYGERGTGKSSTIKSLIWEFGSVGLRMLELDRARLSEFPDVFRALGVRGERYIIFVDDLSFEESETSYKGLKSAIEGSLEVRPPNVLIYATSNRRHIVREVFGDREADTEVHGGDGHQEKLSLADRFGVSILYQTPDQEQFADMVLSIALKRGVRAQEAELRRRALQWAISGNGSSPRSACQFVDSLADLWA